MGVFSRAWASGFGSNSGSPPPKPEPRSVTVLEKRGEQGTEVLPGTSQIMRKVHPPGVP